jgi:hypothetical protein
VRIVKLHDLNLRERDGSVFDSEEFNATLPPKIFAARQRRFDLVDASWAISPDECANRACARPGTSAKENDDVIRRLISES